MNNHNVSRAPSTNYDLPSTHPQSRAALKASVLTRVEASFHAKDVVAQRHVDLYGRSNIHIAWEHIKVVNERIDKVVRNGTTEELNNYLQTKSFFKRPFLRTKIEKELDTLVKGYEDEQFLRSANTQFAQASPANRTS